MDENDRTELIFKKSDDGNIDLITGIDYGRVRYIPYSTRNGHLT